MSTLGWIHTIFGLVALLAGSAVLATRKGTRGHRTLGYLYLTSMLGLNGTALCIYNLFGPLRPLSLAGSQQPADPARRHGPGLHPPSQGRWLERHAIFLCHLLMHRPGGGGLRRSSRHPRPGGELCAAVGLTSAAGDRCRHGPLARTLVGKYALHAGALAERVD